MRSTSPHVTMAAETESSGRRRFRANYADIFYHRSMEKDKLFFLNVCGAYGQKDIKILDRSGPACTFRGRLSVGTKIS